MHVFGLLKSFVPSTANITELKYLRGASLEGSPWSSLRIALSCKAEDGARTVSMLSKFMEMERE